MENKYIKESDVFKIVNDFRVQASNSNERKIYTQILISLINKSKPIAGNELKAVINKYRNKHRRCRTCIHSSNNGQHWHCMAKGNRYFGDVFDTRIAGVFCKLYMPIEIFYKYE